MKITIQQAGRPLQVVTLSLLTIFIVVFASVSRTVLGQSVSSTPSNEGSATNSLEYPTTGGIISLTNLVVTVGELEYVDLYEIPAAIRPPGYAPIYNPRWSAEVLEVVFSDDDHLNTVSVGESVLVSTLDLGAAGSWFVPGEDVKGPITLGLAVREYTPAEMEEYLAITVARSDTDGYVWPPRIAHWIGAMVESGPGWSGVPPIKDLVLATRSSSAEDSEGAAVERWYASDPAVRVLDDESTPVTVLEEITLPLAAHIDVPLAAVLAERDSQDDHPWIVELRHEEYGVLYASEVGAGSHDFVAYFPTGLISVGLYREGETVRRALGSFRSPVVQHGNELKRLDARAEIELLPGREAISVGEWLSSMPLVLDDH